MAGGQRLPVAPALAAVAPWAASARGGGSRGQQLGGASQQLPTGGRTAAAPLTDKEARGAAPVPKVAVLGPGSPCPRPRPSEALWQGDAHLAQRTQLMCWLSENKNFWR